MTDAKLTLDAEAEFNLHTVEKTENVKSLNVDQGNNLSTDSNGNLVLPIFRNFTQKILKVNRIFITADGYSPASPYSNASAYLYVTSAPNNFATCKDYAPYIPGNPILPNLAEYEDRNELRFGLNETVYIQLISGPINTNITAKIYGYLSLPEVMYDV